MDTILLEQMGTRIFERRKQLRLTQEELAEAAGITPQTVSTAELGKKAMRPENIIKVCSALEISTDYLLMGKVASEDKNILLEKVSQLSPQHYCKPMISAHIGKTQIMIKAEHILYIDKYKRGLRIHVIRQAYGTYGITACEDGNCPDVRFQGKMEDTYERLKRYGFGWPHDSYMVNCEYLCYCDAKEFRLTETEGTFQISRSKAKAFREQKDRFLCSKYL